MSGFITPVCNCGLTVGGDNHEPPIGFGGGSFFIDVPNQITIDLAAGEPVGGYKIYKFLATDGEHHHNYTALRNIGVMTELGSSGSIAFDNFRADEPDKARLRMWLSNTKSDPGARVPDVIVDGSGDGSGGAGTGYIKYLDSLTGLTMTNLSKAKRKKRYLGPTSTSVVKWDVVMPDPSDPQNPAKGIDILISAGKPCRFSTDDLYYLYTSFYDVPHS